MIFCVYFQERKIFPCVCKKLFKRGTLLTFLEKMAFLWVARSPEMKRCQQSLQNAVKTLQKYAPTGGLNKSTPLKRSLSEKGNVLRRSGNLSSLKCRTNKHCGKGQISEIRKIGYMFKKNCHPVFLLTDQRRLNHANQKDKGNLREAVKNYLTDFFR